MINCYQCPLRTVCTVPGDFFVPNVIPIQLNWLPDGNEDKCPLYRVAFKQETAPVKQEGKG